MNSNKETGSYYTPCNVIDFMIEYLKKNKQDFTSVLEPSAGDGRFLSDLLPISEHVKAIELFEEKVNDIQQEYAAANLDVQRANFLDYAINTEERYSLIIGNPPYISPKVMDTEDINKAKNLCEAEKINTSVMQNMWLAFVVGACKLLKQNGTIFFVLPMEFLQVQYAEKLRKYLEDKFNTIHIISFKNSIFPDIEQDVCLVYMTNSNKKIPYILYEIFESPNCTTPLFSNSIKKSKPLRKWSNAVLSDKDISLLKDKSANYKMIKNMGVSAPGIVTGGNKFFIITEESVKKYNCEKLVIPILQKSSYISENTIIVDELVLEKLKSNKKPVYLLDLAKIEEKNIPMKLKEYLDWAAEQKVGDIELKDRYKCTNRKPWYGVPIVNKGDVIFFKRYDLVPRVYINRANVHTTDAGYHIRLDAKWDKDSFVFCFYNSLTLAQCEYQGRYYGGGVNELVPSEFKELTIPYRKIKKEDVNKLNNMFIKNTELDEIVEFVNSKTIAEDMNENLVEQIENVRKLLIQRRLG